VVTGPEINGNNAGRLEGLLRAADRTRIKVQIPKQSRYVKSEVDGMYDGEARGFSETRIEKMGKAWISHLNVLRHVVAQNYTSALILEDDADWDVSIRSQALLIASATQQLSKAPTLTTPWGSDWDMFWLGNGGAGSPKHDSLCISLNDSTTIPLNEFRTKRPFYPTLKDKTRLVFETQNPICTFGYAVTQHGARKLLDYAVGPGWAFDVKASDGCVSGDLICMTVAPEIFHHMRWPGLAGVSDNQDDVNNSETPFTMNILHSARCNVGRKWKGLLSCRASPQMRMRYDA
jgi:hypothetical protein